MLLVGGCFTTHTEAQEDPAEIRELASRASSISAEASGLSVQFSIGDRRVAVAALKEFDRAGISYTADVIRAHYSG